jgi:hypothetical protein
MGNNEILYCHAKRSTKKISAGHWFFHTGQWAQCAQASRSRDGIWSLHIDFQMRNKPLESTYLLFDSIDECKEFVSDYFGQAVRQVSSRELPGPESL